MNLTSYPKMLYSFNGPWCKIVATKPSVLRVSLLLVLPFLPLPPAMILYAANHASVFSSNSPLLHWQTIALLVLLAELASVPLIAWKLKNIATIHNSQAAYKETYLLAAITAVPLWLSSLGLLIPSAWAMLACLLLGLSAAASLLYHGTYQMLKLNNLADAQVICYEAFAVGLAAWGLLCGFVVFPPIY